MRPAHWWYVFKAPAPQADIDAARALRADGWSYGAIGRKLGRSRTFAFNHANDVKKPRVRTVHSTTYKNFPHFPKNDPDLKRRILNLAKRGFDVPPSKLQDFETMKRNGYKVPEIRQILKLE